MRHAYILSSALVAQIAGGAAGRTRPFMAGQQQSEIASLRAQLAAREAEIAHLALLLLLARGRGWSIFWQRGAQCDDSRATQCRRRYQASGRGRATRVNLVLDQRSQYCRSLTQICAKNRSNRGRGNAIAERGGQRLFVLCGDSRRHTSRRAGGKDCSPNFETFMLGVIDASIRRAYVCRP